MTLILGGIIKLLGSAGFGTIFGGVMGLFNRKADLDVKRLEREEAKDRMAHELSMRDKDAAIMAQEWAARTKVATVEGEARAEVAGFEALTKSYDFAQPEKGTRMAAFSSFVRPFISLGYWIITSAGSAWILYYAFYVAKVQLSQEQMAELVMYVISWVAFMGGSTIGWFYAMRPGSKMPTFSRGG